MKKILLPPTPRLLSYNSSYFPYAQASFEHIRNAKKFYIDNTKFIPILEDLGSNLFFLRPPRWGKSLLENILESYYDLSVTDSKFQSLFSGLDILKEKTLYCARRYFVLKWDFSVEVETQEIREHLFTKIIEAIVLFALKYGFILGGEVDESLKIESQINPKYKRAIIISSNDALASFDSLVNAVITTNNPLYVIVDEYDRFANKILFESPELFGQVVMGESGKRGSSVLRSIFERVKEASGKSTHDLPFRSFIVGVAPLDFHDASGPNIFEDITHHINVVNMLGFTRQNLSLAMDYLIENHHIKEQQKNSLLDLMEEEYNGYKFLPDQKERLFNPTLSMYLLKQLDGKPQYANKILNLRGKEERRNELLALLDDTNMKVSANVFELLAKNKYTDSVVIKLSSGKVNLNPPHILPKIGIKDLMVDFGIQSTYFLLSIMYYYGVVTFDDQTHVRIPNKLIKNQFIDKLKILTEIYQTDINNFFTKKTSEYLQNALVGISKHLSILDEGNEASLTMRMIALCSTSQSVQLMFENGWSEARLSNGKKRVDLLFKSKLNSLASLIVEIKSIPIYWLDPKQFGFVFLNVLSAKETVGKEISQKTNDEILKLKMNIDIQKDWTNWKGEKVKFKTVGEYIENGRLQTRNYMKLFENETGSKPLAYLVWGVGVMNVYVEEINV